MQVAVAGMAIAASRSRGVMLAGGTQMLAVYAPFKPSAEHMIWRGNLNKSGNDAG